MMNELRGRGLSNVWRHRELGHRRTICEGGCRLMAAWVGQEEKASENRQRKREAKKTDKLEVAPGMTVESLRCFRAALIGPTQ